MTICSAVTRRKRSNGIIFSGETAAACGTAAAADLVTGLAGAWLLSRNNITSRLVIRPARPVPGIMLISRSCSLTSRRTAGDSLLFVERAGSRPEVAVGAAETGAAEIGAAEEAALEAEESAADSCASPSTSPSTLITATIAPTSTVSPACTLMLLTTPSAGASISVAALSVSTSSNNSPFATVSPTFLYQVVTVPSRTVSPSCGISTSIPAP